MSNEPETATAGGPRAAEGSTALSTAGETAYDDAVWVWQKPFGWNFRRRFVQQRVRDYWPVLAQSLDALCSVHRGTPGEAAARSRVLRAWVVPGRRPDVHADSQRYLREMMPDLAAALDRAAHEAEVRDAVARP